MAQITWRNIDAPNLADAMRPLAGAQQSFGGALDSLTKVLAQREATDATNWQTQKSNNTQTALDEIFKYKTPQELAAARSSGALDQALAGFGAQIDRSQVRGVADNRLTTLYQQSQQANAFADQEEERVLRPEVQRVKALAALGKSDEVNAAMAANPRLAQRYGGELVKEGVLGEREAVRFAQGNVKLGEELLNNDVSRRVSLGNLDVNRGQLKVSQGNLEVSRKNQELRTKEFEAQGQERLQKQLAAAMDARAGINTTIASPEGAKMLDDELVKVVKDPENLRYLQIAISKLSANPEFKNLSPALVLRAALGDQAKTNRIWNGSGDGLESLIRDIQKSPDFQAQLARQSEQYKLIDRRVQELRLNLGLGVEPVADAPPAPTPAPTASLFPPPTPIPSNQRPDRGAPLMPWERKPEAEKKTLK